MSTTQPIRDKEALNAFKNYYQTAQPNMRNYTIIIVGLNTALRINDILHLTYDMVYHNKKVRKYIVVKKQKTGKENRPLSRFQAYRMICAAAEAIGITEHISCHSLRKTFGYRAWKQGKDPVVIMLIFNHSSFSVTKRYLCIEQDDKDAVFRDIKI